MSVPESSMHNCFKAIYTMRYHFISIRQCQVLMRMKNHQKSHTLLLWIQNGKTILETTWQFFIQLDIHLTYDLTISLLSFYPGEMKTDVHTETCMQMFTATLLITSKIGNTENIYQLVNDIVIPLYDQKLLKNKNKLLIHEWHGWISKVLY